MNSLELTFHNRQQAWALMESRLFPYLKGALQDGKRLVCTVGLPKRSKPQNRRYWGDGVLAQIAEQATVNGRLYSAEVWHEQMKRQFIGYEELPNGQIIGLSSKNLDIKEFAEFCQKVEAYAVTELGVRFVELQPA